MFCRCVFDRTCPSCSAVDYGSYPQHWLLFDRICQQLILQSESGEDCDLRPTDLNVNNLVQM